MFGVINCIILIQDDWWFQLWSFSIPIQDEYHIVDKWKLESTPGNGLIFCIGFRSPPISGVYFTLLAAAGGPSCILAKIQRTFQRWGDGGRCSHCGVWTTGYSCSSWAADRYTLGGGNSNIFYFHPYLGKIHILTNIFQMGWNHELVLIEPVGQRPVRTRGSLLSFVKWGMKCYPVKQGLLYFIVYRKTVWLEISGVVVSSKSFLSSEFALKSYCKSQKGSRKWWPGKTTPVFFFKASRCYPLGLQGINISHRGKRKIIFKSEFWWDMLVPWRVSFKGGNQLTLHKNFPILAEEK